MNTLNFCIIFMCIFLKERSDYKNITQSSFILARHPRKLKFSFFNPRIVFCPTFKSPQSFSIPPILTWWGFDPHFLLLKLLPFCQWLNCHFIQQDVQTSHLSAFTEDLMQTLSVSSNILWHRKFIRWDSALINSKNIHRKYS